MGKIKDAIKNNSSSLLVFMCIFCFIFFIYLMKQQENKNAIEPIDDKPVYDLAVDILKRQNDSLINRIKLLDDKAQKMKSDIDSLEKVKSKIKIKYDEKIKELNDASNMRIYTELKSILAKDSIR